MKYSIVTVAYNEENRISETIESVLNQDFSGFEYIVVDGESKDSTLDIANSYIEKFAEKGIEYHVYSEKDSGVYNAMNKSLEFVHGEYVLYMNAGDLLDSKTVINEVDKFISASPDIIYGRTRWVLWDLYHLVKAEDPQILLEYMPFCHQSVFVRTELLKKYGFDEEYRICSDYNFFVQMYLNDVSFCRTDIIFSKFAVGGLSYENYGKDELVERTEIRFRNKIIDEKQKNIILSDFEKTYMKRKVIGFIKSVIPNSITRKILTRRYLKSGWEKL